MDLQLDSTRQPATFIDRGAKVPFQHPHLKDVRVRRRNHTLELLVEGFGDARGRYVLPFSHVPEMFPQLSARDRALHRRICEAVTPSPLIIHLASLELTTDNKTPDGVWARQTLRAYADISQRTRLYLLHAVLQRHWLGKTLDVAALETEAGMASATNVLNHLAIDRGTTHATIDDALNRCAEVIWPIGSPQLRAAAPLSRDIFRVSRLQYEVTEAAEQHKDHSVAGHAAAIAASAHAIVTQTHSVISQIDRICDDILPLLSAWDRIQTIMYEMVHRLSWYLDGWPEIIDLWEATDRTTARQVATALAKIMSMLPSLPKAPFAALDDGSQPLKGKCSKPGCSTARTVRGMHCWLTGRDLRKAASS